MKRRYLLLGGLGAAGALVIGWGAAPVRRRLQADHPLPTAAGQYALNGWVKVATDETVTVVMSQAEMGQGVRTGLAMLLAEELDAPWERIALEPASRDPLYNNATVIVDSLPFAPEDHGWLKRSAAHAVQRILRELPDYAGTGGSSSIKDQFLPLREAGAAARAVLIEAAAARWQVPAAQCAAQDGRVTHPSGRSASFGELAPAAARLPLPRQPRLKTAAQFTLLGRPLPRLDTAAKVDGSARFGSDVMPPELLHAALSLCPVLGGRVARVEAAAALALPGVHRVVVLPPVAGGLASVGSTSGGIAVIADTTHQAQRALAQVTVQWEAGAAASLSSRALEAELAAALDAGEGRVHFERGDVEAALAQAARRIDAEYRVPFLAHAAMEPMNCTVRVAQGRATVWTGTQAPGLARRAAAQALGIEAARIAVEVPYLGGGFGRRYLTDCVTQAALIAREMPGRAVRLQWSREQDMQHDFYRPAFVCRASAALDSGGALLAWQTRSSGSSLGAPAWLDSATDGAANTAYEFRHARMTHHPVESAVPMGIWRSVNHSQNAFFMECFLDECALAARRDPVEFRAALLVGSPRDRAVLARAAQLSAWGRARPAAADGAACAQGIALHRCFGSVVAQVAEVSRAPDGRLRVHRVVCVVDCGLAINPNLIRQQIESAVVFGLSAALAGEIGIEDGRVQQSNFHDYRPLRMDECPRIETEIMASEAPPGGIGEVGTPPIAPAVANAWFALTGERLRRLPLRPAGA